MRRPSDSFWRRHRPAHPALCRRRFSGLHAFAGRHGHALAEESRPALAEERAVNGLGAFVTGVTVVVVLVAKFAEGAWITLLFIPLTIVFFVAVRRHYHSVRCSPLARFRSSAASLSQPPIAVIPIDRWSNITRQGIEFAARLSPEVIALHVEPSEHSELLQDGLGALRRAALPRGRQRAAQAPRPAFALPLRHHSHRSVRSRSFEEHPDRSIIVVIPELVEDRWYEYFLHNQRGRLLEWVLLARGNERIFTVSAPWYVGEHP